MAGLLAAIAGTAIVVGVATALFVRSRITNTFAETMGSPPGVDPATHHRRALEQAEHDATQARERAELLQLSLDALAAGVILADSSGNVLVQNRLATEIASQSHEQALLGAATTELLAAAANGHSGERHVETFGPPPKSLFVHAVPVSSEGQVVGALAIVDDVTDFQRIEKTRRDFVANLSHELRTPVGAASLLGEMLVGEDDPAVRQQLTDRLMIETDRMTATIDDLLALSRIEAAAEAPFDEVVDLQSVIDEALARNRVASESAGVQLGASDSEQVTLTGNRDQLLTALVNLVENAVKYSEPGDTVTVSSSSDGGLVHLAVQDTGRGIPARDLDRIFERFYRVDRSRNSTTGGTGIGLSIVRHVALNHGGTVNVASSEGQGSTFTMVLPMRQDVR